MMFKFTIPAFVVALASAWCHISWAVTVNALIKSNQDMSRIRRLASPAVITFHHSDLTISGALVLLFSAVLALTFTVAVVLFLLPSTNRIRSRPPLATTLISLILTLGLTAALATYTFFVAHHRLIITAVLAGNTIPQAIIDQHAKSLGIDTRYSHFFHLKLAAILPWFAVLLAYLAVASLWFGYRCSPSDEGGSGISREKGNSTIQP